jgi:Icc-related predicted phosphoesterase
MRILQVSDIHGSLEAVEKISRKAGEVNADLIVIAGDITHFGGPSTALKILEKISKSSLPTFFVSGNCDSPELLSWQPEGLNAYNLHGRLREFSGYFFAGVGGGSGKFGTLTELEEDGFEDVLRGFRGKSDRLILVAHSPPYGTGADYTGMKHIGSISVKRFVEEVGPLLVCAGHAHEGRSITRLGSAVIVNAGPAKDGFCAIIEVEDSSVDPQLTTL